ncbi:MAG: hypothetical protein E6357_16680 [Clostridiales bacterium]|nr:hypothetical protein [Clostridiales bacterium]
MHAPLCGIFAPNSGYVAREKNQEEIYDFKRKNQGRFESSEARCTAN